MGGLAYGLVKRILYRGSSLKFTAFFSSNSRLFIALAVLGIIGIIYAGFAKSQRRPFMAKYFQRGAAMRA